MRGRFRFSVVSSSSESRQTLAQGPGGPGSVPEGQGTIDDSDFGASCHAPRDQTASKFSDILLGKGIGLVGQQENLRLAGGDFFQVHPGVALGRIAEYVSKAEVSQKIMRVGSSRDRHPGIFPDGEKASLRGSGPGLRFADGPSEIFQDRLCPRRGGAQGRQPFELRHGACDGVGKIHPDAKATFAQAAYVDFPIFFEIGQDQIGLQATDRGKVRILGATYACDLSQFSCGVDAPFGHADHPVAQAQSIEAFGDARYQRDDAAGVGGKRNDGAGGVDVFGGHVCQQVPRSGEVGP